MFMGTNEKYTLEVCDDGKIFKIPFLAGSDREAVEGGRGYFLEKVRCESISKKSILQAIYRTPENLLEGQVTVEETRGESRFSLATRV